MLEIESGRCDPALASSECPVFGTIGGFGAHALYRRNLKDLEGVKLQIHYVKSRAFRKH